MDLKCLLMYTELYKICYTENILPSASMNFNWRKLLDDVREFGRETTIHGFPLLVSYQLHTFERLFWATIIIIALVSGTSLCLFNWRRYLANPTVISIKKDFRNWNNPFPAATACLYYKTDDILSDEYVMNTWNVNNTHPLYDYYVEFAKSVANISYQSLEVFRKYENDSSLNGIDMMDLAVKVYPGIIGSLFTSDEKHKATWTLIMTEMGICFTINSFYAGLFAYRLEDKQANPSETTVLRCHYLNGLCYARFDSEPDFPIKVYIHSYLDTVHATISPPWYVGESQEIEVNYRMQETVSDNSLKSLSPAQRRCRFENEPVTKQIKYYSSSICYTLCRYNLVMKLCGCRPFFYHNLDGKVCDIKGLLCVADHSQYLTQSPSKLGCNCPQQCNIMTYLAEIPKMTVWSYGYFDQRITFRWGLLPPTTKYQRDVLFGFEDLVVSFGGIVALFLGISFISIIETIFLLLRLLFHCYQLF